ncbi:MAG: diaminopimelate epimerase, partial [Clostridiaceae bacterium]
VRKSEKAQIRMDIFNADGSYAAMCGNGIRCFAKYVYEKDIVKNTEITIETGDGIKIAYLEVVEEDVRNIKINMGFAKFEEDIKDKKIFANNKEYIINTINLGVPHTMIFGKLEDYDVEEGKYIEKLSIFREGTNVNFCEVIKDDEINIKTFERGAGATLACGTGTCASVYLAYYKGFTKNKVLANLPGGKLFIEIEEDGIYMTGPAKLVFSGEINLKY